MSKHTQSIIKWAIKLSLGLGLTVALVFMVGWRELANQLKQVDRFWLIGVYTALWVGQWISAFQMQRIFSFLNVRLQLRRIFFASQLATFYSLLVPGDLAASGAKWANLSAATGKRSLVLNAMVYNRLIQAFVPLMIGTLALCIHSPISNTWYILIPITALLLLFSVLVSLYNSSFGQKIEKMIRVGFHWLPVSIYKKLDYFLCSMNLIRTWTFVDHVRVVMLALLWTGTTFASFTCALWAVDIDISLLTVLWVYAFLVIVRLLPLTIANLGIREGALILLLQPYGISSDQAVSAGLIMFTNTLFMAVVGLGYQLFLLTGWAKWKTSE